MSKPHVESLNEFAGRTATLFAAWLGTLTIAQVQDAIGAISGVVLLGYTIAKWRALRKWERAQLALQASQRQAQAAVRPMSPTEPGEL